MLAASDPMAKVALAFEHLNLRWNPFGEPAAEDLADLAVVEVEQHVERLKRPGFAVEYMGESGRGKSTHMHALHRFFPDAPYVRFRENEPIPPIPNAPLLFLDETQRVPARRRRQVFARPASFVIGTHEDHSTEFKRAGVQCEVILLRGLTPERLEQIVLRRLEWARRRPGPLPGITETEIARLIHDHDDDLSAILKHLYEKFQLLETGASNGNPGAL